MKVKKHIFSTIKSVELESEKVLFSVSFRCNSRIVVKLAKIRYDKIYFINSRVQDSNSIKLFTFK